MQSLIKLTSPFRICVIGGHWTASANAHIISVLSIGCRNGNWNFRSHVLSLPGAKVPGSESSKERKFQGTKVPGSESSRERKYPGAKVPGNESSRVRKYQGAKVPPMVLSLLGAKVRGNESSIIRRNHSRPMASQ